jgi:ribosome biogenesis GTPase
MPARVTDVHRDRLDVLGTEGPLTLVPGQLTGAYAVGDWVYHDGQQVCQVLERKTAIGRGAAG